MEIQLNLSTSNLKGEIILFEFERDSNYGKEIIRDSLSRIIEIFKLRGFELERFNCISNSIVNSIVNSKLEID